MMDGCSLALKLTGALVLLEVEDVYLKLFRYLLMERRSLKLLLSLKYCVPFFFLVCMFES